MTSHFDALDIPGFLRLTAEQRRQAWIDCPAAAYQPPVSVKAGAYSPSMLADPGTREMIAGIEAVEQPVVERSAGGKMDIIAELLRRPEGCTLRDVLAATGWTAVSMPAAAKRIGVELRKEKVDGVTRYYGSND